MGYQARLTTGGQPTLQHKEGVHDLTGCGTPPFNYGVACELDGIGGLMLVGQIVGGASVPKLCQKGSTSSHQKNKMDQ